ncbi:MAG: hypothetical protein WA139_01055 [Candidatus Aenigmatarchaeota archaeon]
MKTAVVFDMHGIIFCHSPDFDVSKSGELFEGKIRQYSESVGGYENAWKNYQNGDLKLALKIENVSISKGIKGDSSELQIYEMPGAISRVLDCHKKGCKVVFVSTSEIGTSKNILEYLLGKHKIESEKKIIASFDILNMNDYGSKKDTEAWKAVLKPYKNITDIYEDKEKNLKASGDAARQLGSNPMLHISIEK